MIDQAKRKTLKAITAVTGVGAAVAISGTALASTLSAGLATETTDALHELASIQVSTRLSVEKNDLEIVLTNIGKEQVTITQMTPAVTDVPRGRFDFSALLQGGPLQMAAGESVTVPIQRRPISIATTQIPSGAPLISSLKKSMSIVTEADSFAMVSVLDKTVFV